MSLIPSQPNLRAVIHHETHEEREVDLVIFLFFCDLHVLRGIGYQLKAGHFPPFWFYGNFTTKRNLMSC